MRVAVTGGSGQLGTVILRRLLADRAIKEIVSLDVRPPILASPRLRAVQMDVRDSQIGRHMEGCEALFHLAFVVVRHLPREEYESINIGGSKNVFLAARKAGVKTIVYASSVAAYGNAPGHKGPVTEDSPRHYFHQFPYSACKYKVEEFLDAFEAQHPDLSIARMRPAILIGHRMDHPLGLGLKKRRAVILGPEPVPIVWDEDVADAFVLAFRKRARGAFNLWAGSPSMEEIADEGGMRKVRAPRSLAVRFGRLALTLSRAGLLKEALDPVWLELPEAPREYPTDRAREILGWRPKCATGLDVVRRFVKEVPPKLDPKIAAFFGFLGLMGKYGPPVPEMANMSARLHLCLTGPGGGDVGVFVKDSRALVRFAPPRPPDVVVTLKAAHFLDLMTGALDLSSAQLTGKLRVEGEVLSGLIFNGVVASFRAGLEAKGARGFFTRKIADWFTQGVSA